jgi:hypothetical protein
MSWCPNKPYKHQPSAIARSTAHVEIIKTLLSSSSLFILPIFAILALGEHYRSTSDRIGRKMTIGSPLSRVNIRPSICLSLVAVSPAAARLSL